MIHHDSGRVSAEKSMTGTFWSSCRGRMLSSAPRVMGESLEMPRSADSQRRWAMSSFPLFPYKIRQTTWSTRMRMYHYNSLHIITEPPSDRSSFLQTPLGSMRMALSCWLCNAMAVRGVISYASGGLLSGRTLKYYERPSAKGTANAGRSFHAYDDISGYRSICAIVRFLGISNS